MTGYILEDKNYNLKNSSRTDFGVVERISPTRIKCSTVGFSNLCQNDKFGDKLDREENEFDGFRFYSSVDDLLNDTHNLETGDFIVEIHATDDRIKSKYIDKNGITRYFSNTITGMRLHCDITIVNDWLMELGVYDE